MIIYMILALVLASISKIIGDKYIIKYHKDTNKVHDLSHNILPSVKINPKLNYFYDMYTALPIFILIGLGLLKAKLNVIFQYYILLGIIYFIRPFFYCLTVLPDPSGKCDGKKEYNKSHPFYENMYGTCRDLIFSGHIASSYLAWKFLIDYFSISPVYGILHQVSVILLMMCQRKHYSIDVLIAFLVTYLLYDKKDFLDKII